MIRSLYKIFKRLKGLVHYLVLLILRSPVDTILCIINALFLKNIFQAIELGDLAAIQKSCLQFVVANGFLFLYNGILWGEFAVFSARFVGKVKQYVFECLFLLPLWKIEAKDDGAWLTRTNSDAKMTLNLLTGALNIPHFVFAIVRIIVASLILGSLSPMLLLVELFVLIPHAIARQIFVVKPVEHFTRSAQEHVEQATVYMSAMVECKDAICLYDANDLLLERYKEKSFQVVKARLEIGFRKAMGEFFHVLLSRGGYLLLFFIGCEMLLKEQIEFGTLTAAFQYRGAMVMGTMLLLNSLVEIKKNSIGLKRMEEIYETEE